MFEMAPVSIGMPTKTMVKRSTARTSENARMVPRVINIHLYIVLCAYGWRQFFIVNNPKSDYPCMYQQVF